MFEYRIQQAWDNYRADFGLGRLTLFIAFYNTFLFFLSGLFFGGFQVMALYPVAFAMVFYLLRPKFVRFKDTTKLVLNVIPLTITIALNYFLVGEMDRGAQLLTRYDPFFSGLDLWLFGKPIAALFAQVLVPAGMIGTLIYDLMMTSYFTYYLIPWYGAILYFRQLPPQLHYRLGRYQASVIIFFCLNYLMYLTVPVEGPQYYLQDYFTDDLPFSPWGQHLWWMVRNGQTTFIDCFPSGHLGITILVAIWLFKINHSHRYFMAFMVFCIGMATLAIRYHYTLDLIFALPLALVSFKLGNTLLPSMLDLYSYRRDQKGEKRP